MNISEIYDSLLTKDVNNADGSVVTRTGMFSAKDLIKVFSGLYELYFIIDKDGLIEFMNSIISKINQLPPKDEFNHMIDIFNLLGNEIGSYYGHGEQADRLSFYQRNGAKTDDEDIRICSMSQIKGRGIAECAEKAALANNVLLMLNSMGLFDYQVNYLNALTTLSNGKTEGHAFLEFDRINTRGEVIHIIYDVTNPEKVMLNGQEFYYPALYSLNDEEYKSFLQGNPFDNSKFIMANNFQIMETRKYQGFAKADEYNENLKELREEYKEMMDEPTNYDYESHGHSGIRR